MEEVVWKDIPGYEGRYQASNLGDIRSLSYEGHNEIKTMKQQIRKDGYLQIQLLDKKYLSHRIVAITFIENKKINHK